MARSEKDKCAKRKVEKRKRATGPPLPHRVARDHLSDEETHSHLCESCGKRKEPQRGKTKSKSRRKQKESIDTCCIASVKKEMMPLLGLAACVERIHHTRHGNTAHKTTLPRSQAYSVGPSDLSLQHLHLLLDIRAHVVERM
jgi:hypothetical protein